MKKVLTVFVCSVFALSLSAQWVQQSPFIMGASQDGSVGMGSDVVLSADGKTAVQVVDNIDNKTNCGFFVFRLLGGAWVQQAVINYGQPSGVASLAVSADGNTVAVASTQYWSLSVYVYDNDKWRLQSKIVPGRYWPTSFTSHKVSLSYDGNTLLSRGHIWVRSGNSWTYQAQLIPTDRNVATSAYCDTAQRFSCFMTCSLSGDGNTAAISDLYGPDSTTNVWIFARNGSNWSQQAPRFKTANSNNSGDGEARQVVISGDGKTVALAGIASSRKALLSVFVYSGGVWTQQALAAPGPGEGEVVSVALSHDGNKLVCRPTFHEVLWYYQRTGSTWQRIGTDHTINTPGPYERFGEPAAGGAVPLTMDSAGTGVIYGTPYYRFMRGTCFYFKLVANAWVHTGGELFGIGAEGGSSFGENLSMSRDGKILAVAGKAEGGNEGGVWVYERQGADWLPIGNKITIADNVWQPRLFGKSVSVSANGNILAVGAPKSNMDNNGYNGGNVYVYSRNGNSYAPMVDSITVGKRANFGSCVSLSDSGNTLLACSDSGAYVYTYTGTTWQPEARLYRAGVSNGPLCVLSGDGNTAVVGSTDAITGKSALDIYVRNGSNWTLQKMALYPATIPGGVSYASMALSQNGDVLAVGCPMVVEASYAFYRTGTTWTESSKKLVTSGTWGQAGLGIAVSTSGDTIVDCSRGYPSFYYANGLSGVNIYVRNGSNVWQPKSPVPAKAFLSPDMTQRNSVAASGDMQYIAAGEMYRPGRVAVVYRTDMREASVTINRPTCMNSSNGSLSVQMTGGTDPYKFSWAHTATNTNSLSALAPGLYRATISDANGTELIREYEVTASDSLQVIDYGTKFNCGTGTATINLYPMDGQLPYTYQWSGLRGQTGNPATGLVTGTHQFTVTDNSGCVYSGEATVDSAVWPQITKVEPNCADNGSATILMYGGTAPYTYTWSNGQQTPVATALGAGIYTATVTDSTGCSVTGSTTLNADCGNMIMGHIFFDRNNNCVQDSGERSVPDLTMAAYYIGGTVYGNTDVNGDYSIFVPAGHNCTVEIEHWQQCRFRVCSGVNYPGQAVFTGTNDTVVIDFPLKDKGIDMALTVSYTEPNPGFDMSYTIYYGNLRDSVLPAEVALYYDRTLSLVSTTPPYTSLDTFSHFIKWVVDSAGSPDNVNQQVNAIFKVPVTALPGSRLEIDGFVAAHDLDALRQDCNTDNNTVRLSIPVTGSLDPNYKMAEPSGKVEPGGMLTYTIHFQNTGTAPTHFVEISDTLSPHVDPGTIRTVATSHRPYTFSISKGGILRWLFSPLALPDSTTDPIASQGFVSYQIYTRSDRPVGTPVENTAFIYFDYNSPVQTNTEVNLLYDVATVIDVPGTGIHVRTYPNPFSGYTTFELEGNISPYDVVITDLLGQQVEGFNNIDAPTFRFNRGSLAAGCYLFKIQMDGQLVANGKLVVE